MSAQCPNRAPSALSRPQAGAAADGDPLAERPKPHDMATLLYSGYLDRLGFDYRPATPSSMFREPSKVTEAHAANP
jgi:phospholipase C